MRVIAVTKIASGLVLAAVVLAKTSAGTTADHDRISVLNQQLYEAADEGYKDIVEGEKRGRVTEMETVKWLRRRAEARIGLGGDKAALITFLEGYAHDLELRESRCEEGVRQGILPKLAATEIRYERVNAQLWLARAQM